MPYAVGKVPMSRRGCVAPRKAANALDSSPTKWEKFQLMRWACEAALKAHE